MDNTTIVQNRANGQCEVCSSSPADIVFEVPPSQQRGADGFALLCSACNTQLEHPDQVNPDHWRCLNDSMWSTVPAVQVIAWRMLHQLRGEGWPVPLLDMLYLDEETLAWAHEGYVSTEDQAQPHVDSNGALLEAGDTVTLVKDLKVKGANFTAKRGTAVRRISLVHGQPDQIEGKVNGQQIVILTQYVKKAK